MPSKCTVHMHVQCATCACVHYMHIALASNICKSNVKCIGVQLELDDWFVGVHVSSCMHGHLCVHTIEKYIIRDTYSNILILIFCHIILLRIVYILYSGIRVNLRKLTGGTVASKNREFWHLSGTTAIFAHVSRWLRKISTNLAGDATDKLFTSRSCLCDSIMTIKTGLKAG